MVDEKQARSGSGPSPECPSELLRAQALRAGLVDHFFDAFGHYTLVSDETLTRALEALGYAPCEPIPEGAAGGPFLCFCLVHRPDRGPLGVPLSWPAGRGPGRWQIVLEATPGEEAREGAHGIFAPEDLPPLEGEGRDPELHKRLEIPVADLPLGYHRLRIEGGDAPAAEVPLILVPERCWLPEGTEDGSARFWGVTCQVHGLRSKKDWGMGDFGALAILARDVGQAGGDIVGLNPLNALFLTRPLHASPYSPNSRLFLNPLYISIDDVPETARTGEIDLLREKLGALEFSETILYGEVGPLKLRALKAAFRTFNAEERPRKTPRFQEFERFVAEGGPLLEDFARFQALSEHFEKGGCSWQCWPDAYKDPTSAAVSVFAEVNRSRVDFHLWCQFEADRQLGLCALAARSSGQRLGLYRDLAVGSDPSGADAWMMGGQLVRDLCVGAPPDPMNALGQNWGFPPFHPRHLQENGFEVFRRLIRANMRHAAVLRIDHVLGLMRTFCIVRGFACKDGLYVLMPFEDMLGILALESHRARCMVIGEDLGTIPDGFQDRMQAAGVLSTRLFYFERHYHSDGSLKWPDEYPRLAAVSPNSHDLPTLRGFWAGRDLAWKHELNLFPSDGAREGESNSRFHDRPLIRDTLARGGLELEETNGYTPPSNLVPAVCDWLARTPSLVVTVQMEDVLEEVEQANLPGTVEGHPNWCRRLSADVESLPADGRLAHIAGLFARYGRGTRSESS
ncbi:4-alpha-glucanotransferase [Phaeovibrio sulfidiphilus]|uniref:4-alpha-glucanotransferase n=1 Tax=Phaeovibrio sulfidiphilus TaxID=1220600 RepID=A0A8J6YVY8_9PROT|nr:4-alpha-glucanotransferase [Phaeovibrio sulfidiphilus]MBE1236717.1 4-alpha-glucanotransferase [Phaeovibrio sulfidiphilus]